MSERQNGHYPSEASIIAENLGKQYRIGLKEGRHDTLMQSAIAFLGSPLANLRNLRNLSRFEEEDAEDIIWALRDVSFTINRGEVVGVIGRNGAGKSTLLKVLSRITTPTAGRVILNGRVTSLLEVGTGFHPELTGRENVYLNGTILGMTKSEVDRKFDEIVAFSEIEKFIDTPAKRYSSGMRVRLAFAVSAHLESEILLVDEVLAVGDAAFREKCLNKMDGVAKIGRTVILVSHNMQVIQRLCDRAFLIQQGHLVKSGPPGEVIEAYLQDYVADPLPEPRTFDDELRLNAIRITQDGYEVGEIVDNQKPATIHLAYDVLQPIRNLLLGFDVFSGDGAHLYRTFDILNDGFDLREPGAYESVYELPAGAFSSGTYYLDLLLSIHRRKWLTRNEIRLRMQFGGVREFDVRFPGLIGPVGQWEVKRGVPDSRPDVVTASI